MKRKLKLTILTVIILLFVLIVALIIIENNMVQLNKYDVSTCKLPSDLNLKIAHISDFHNTKLKDKALERLAEAEPDIIVVTGDLIDSRKTDVKLSVDFMEKAMKIAPCYYVTGNHEARVDEYKKLKDGLIELGVVVLENDSVIIEKSGDYIALLGTEDPSFKAGNNETVMTKALQEIASGEEYTILLSHRPELFNIYSDYFIDLVLAGHAHGGQFRLPFIGGLVAPDQGYFPQYDSGEYIHRDTVMIVSRGIGNSIIPIRFNNRPEVVLVVLESES